MTSTRRTSSVRRARTCSPPPDTTSGNRRTDAASPARSTMRPSRSYRPTARTGSEGNADNTVGKRSRALTAESLRLSLASRVAMARPIASALLLSKAPKLARVRLATAKRSGTNPKTRSEPKASTSCRRIPTRIEILTDRSRRTETTARAGVARAAAHRRSARTRTLHPPSEACTTRRQACWWLR